MFNPTRKRFAPQNKMCNGKPEVIRIRANLAIEWV
jgi:hypothetical protein